jgi:hypothetical protein
MNFMKRGAITSLRNTSLFTGRIRSAVVPKFDARYFAEYIVSSDPDSPFYQPPTIKGLNTLVYLDIEIGQDTPKRMTIELFDEIVPRTAKNFRQLCTGEVDYSYKESGFHRIINGFMAQGGDLSEGDGTGGYSAVGNGRFRDENFLLKHTRRGLLSSKISLVLLPLYILNSSLCSG